MASLGRINNALTQLTQETTLALANINFDFSIVKQEAPLEYQPLGRSLTKTRINKAEDGQIHVTARKLGALFAGEIPDVPALIEAYGKRASEIAAVPDVNPQGSRQHGAFADHIGIDGTSIWAAVTSGKHVITIHLLACMLARIWQPHEAISIWDELVAGRKAKLANTADQTSVGNFVDEAASRIILDRSQLREWDACARSWLAAADKAKARQHTQYRLIIENLSLPVSSASHVYQAVITAWKQALQALDHLISGQPQQVKSASALLGISAWHLYPRLCIIRDQLHHIDLQDGLIAPGGILTIGLEPKPGADPQGVFWSLPLAHMRYYGHPENVTRSASIDASRVTLAEFDYVCLGALLASWKIPDTDMKQLCELLQILLKDSSIESCEASPKYQHICAHCLGLQSFADACSNMLTPESPDRVHRRRLLKYGQRNCQRLFEGTSVPGLRFCKSPLTHLSVAMKIARLATDRGVALIQAWLSSSHARQNDFDAIMAVHEADAIHWSDAFPSTTSEASKMFATWQTAIEPCIEQDGGVRHRITKRMRKLFPPEISARCKEGSWHIANPFAWRGKGPWLFVRDIQEINIQLVDLHISLESLTSFIADGVFTGQQFLEAGLSSSLDATIHWTLLHNAKGFSQLWSWHKLRRLYAALPGTYISLAAIKDIKLHELTRFWERPTSRPEKPAHVHEFAQVAELSYGIKLPPIDDLDQVIAMAVEDSLFVASHLVDETDDKARLESIIRYPGSLGRSGVTLLVCATNPKICTTISHLWRLIDHEDFDENQPNQHFQQTTLHLTLTGFEVPATYGRQGFRDTNVSIVEAAVSLHGLDGAWYADLDATLIQRYCASTYLPKHCSHTVLDRKTALSSMGLLTIKNWAELLDPPTSNAVLLAGGEYIVRMTAACICLQQGYRFFVLDTSSLCWACMEKAIKVTESGNDEMPSNRHNLPEMLRAERPISAEYPSAITTWVAERDAAVASISFNELDIASLQHGSPASANKSEHHCIGAAADYQSVHSQKHPGPFGKHPPKVKPELGIILIC